MEDNWNKKPNKCSKKSLTVYLSDIILINIKGNKKDSSSNGVGAPWTNLLCTRQICRLIEFYILIINKSRYFMHFCIYFIKIKIE